MHYLVENVKKTCCLISAAAVSFPPDPPHRPSALRPVGRAAAWLGRLPECRKDVGSTAQFGPFVILGVSHHGSERDRAETLT